MFSSIQKLFEPKTNCLESAKLLTDLLKVKITSTTLRKGIEEHPDYPSLLCISDVLSNYGIANIAANFAKEKFPDIPTPFITSIAGTQIRQNFFAVVSKISAGNITFYDHENGKWDTSSLTDFFERCSGVVLMAEAEEGAGEKDYIQVLKEEKRKEVTVTAMSIGIPLLLVFSGIISITRYGNSAILPVIFSILTLAGAIVSILLLLYELDQYSPVIQKICRPTNKINCAAVLNSKRSKIAGISWATIGFTYFTGQLLLILFLGIVNTNMLFAVSWLNLLAVPYILFSLYYQWRIIKQWCALCLSVQLLLFLQLAVSIAGQWHTGLSFNEALTASMLTSTFLAMLIPFIAVSLLIPAYRSVKKNSNSNLQLQRLKHDPKIFGALLARQKSLPVTPEEMGIVLGNPEASTKLVKVCNPYCGPCSESHKTIEYLLDHNPDLQVQIIFFTAEDVHDIRKEIARHLLAIAEKGDPAATRAALDAWYLNSSKIYENFARAFPLNGEVQKQSDKVEAMQNWCMSSDIEFTPTFFVNGRQLPPMYNVTDLKYFLSV